ncbi:MAG TPA: NAD(P)H-binding protein [Polyangia bacterium]|jgi:NADH dehydrogenase|nr:NAD(P)H-binding protein [Polyangia bacterium]
MTTGLVKGPVLITGAAGEVGRRLVARIAADGHQVRALVLPNDPLRARLDGLKSRVDIREGDIRDPATLDAVVAGVDTVLHLAAVILAQDPSVFDRVNRRGTAHLVAASAAAGVRHFIYVSSASVVYPRLTPYGRSKLEAEAIVKGEPRLLHTIVRPTLVYDETGGQEFALFRRYLHRFPVVPFVGPTDGPRAARKRPIHADDAVDGLARMVGSQAALGQTYNLSGAETITLADLGRLVLSLEGKSKPFLPIPTAVCQAIARALGAVMDNPPLTPYAVAGFTNQADLDPARTMRDLDWHPRGVRAGLAACLAPSGAASEFEAAPSTKNVMNAAAPSAHGRSA